MNSTGRGKAESVGAGVDSSSPCLVLGKEVWGPPASWNAKRRGRYSGLASGKVGVRLWDEAF